MSLLPHLPSPPRLVWPALIWLATAMPVGAGAWMLARYESAAEHARFEQTVAQATQAVTLRLRECETKVLALASWLDNIGPPADNAAWELAEQRLQVGRSGACNGAVTASRQLAPEQVAAFEAEQSARLGHPYQVRPPGQRAWYAPNLLVAPMNDYNRRMLGLDPANAPKRREALERARDTGRPAATVRVDLRMLNDSAMAVMMYAPVYRRGLPQATIEQRRAAVLGWVGQPLRIDEVIAATAAEYTGLGLTLIDPKETPVDKAAAAPPGGTGLNGSSGSSGSSSSAGSTGSTASTGSSTPATARAQGAMPSRPPQAEPASQPRPALRAPAAAPAGPTLDQPLRFGERDWVLRATSLGGPAAGEAWRASQVLAVAGLLLASMAAAAGAFLLRQQGRAYGLARRFSRKLRLHASGLRAVLEGARDGIVQIDMQGCILSANAAAERLLGRADLVGRQASDLFPPAQQEAAAARYREAVQRARLGEVIPISEIQLQHAAGQLLPVRSLMSRAVVQDREQMIWLIGDVSREHALRAQAAQAEHMNALLLDAVPSALLLVDKRGRITRCNPAARLLLGYTENDLLGRELASLCEPAPFRASRGLVPGLPSSPLTDLASHLASGFVGASTGDASPFRSQRDDAGRLVEVEWTMRRRDGHVVPVVMLAVAVNAAASPLDTRRADSTLLLLTDISERKRATAQIEHLALHDSLTGLPNRLQLEERARHALLHAAQQRQGVALVLMDLDRFKQINDTLGHPVGDRLLQVVAERLADSVRSGDLVARMGGDEFVLLLRDIASPADAMRVVEKVLAAFRGTDMDIDGHRLRVTPSIGVALYPNHGHDLAGLLSHADLAMYRAKAAGGDTALVFDPERHAINAARLRLETDLRLALQAGELRLHYQPLVEAASGRVAGLEALMRWHHPVLGMVPPGDFISIAEETGEIVAIGAWALRQACADLARLRLERPELTVAVNVSARQLLGHDLVGDVTAALAAAGLPGKALEIEITESALVETQDHVLDKLAQLRALGLGIAIDDFGTGYSSLAYLGSFPVTTLKVDRSFVRQIDSELGPGTLAAAIVSLAHSMGLETVAEGVETAAQWSVLRETGCQRIQGFLFSPAVPLEQLPQTLARIASQARPRAARRVAEEARVGLDTEQAAL